MASLRSTIARARSERGAELIEFAFVLPVLLLVVAGIIDFGFLFREYEVVTNAAREGARLISLGDKNYKAQDVYDRVASYATASGLNPKLLPTPDVADVTIDTPAGPAKGHRVTVFYFHEYWILGPISKLFGGSFQSVTLTAVSTMRSEIQAE
jgi:Flp pilus assembly protein TadG